VSDIGGAYRSRGRDGTASWVETSKTAPTFHRRLSALLQRPLGRWPPRRPAGTGATPMFDLNVMTAPLSDQIAMLRSAQQVDKLPVKYVELGNEFYLCDTDYVQAFPTAQD
jgi:hypothetical protein